jgi:hypothetical protein
MSGNLIVPDCGIQVTNCGILFTLLPRWMNLETVAASREELRNLANNATVADFVKCDGYPFVNSPRRLPDIGAAKKPLSSDILT